MEEKRQEMLYQLALAAFFEGLAEKPEKAEFGLEGERFDLVVGSVLAFDGEQEEWEDELLSA